MPPQMPPKTGICVCGYIYNISVTKGCNEVETLVKRIGKPMPP